MELNSKSKVLLCQKALYAKQLSSYAELCKVYKILAEEFKDSGMQNASPEVLSENVQKYYGAFLAKAAEGDLKFINDTESQIFNATEKAAFYSFANNSMKLNYFKVVSEALSNATQTKRKDGTVSFSIDEAGMQNFHNYLNPPRELFSDKENNFFDRTGRSFERIIAENPKRWIGHTYYRVAANALRTINEIDSTHISQLDTKGISLSPKSFGATITGARGSITPSREFSSPKQEFKSEIDTLYTSEEKQKYSQQVSTIENLGAKVYGAGHRAKEKAKATYTANKGTIQKAVKQAAKIGLALGVSAAISLAIRAGINAHTFNQLSANTNPEQGYSVVVTQDTLDKLNELESRINETENSNSIPSTQELGELRDDIDDILDLVVEDLVRQSFEEQYPNLKIAENGIQTSYDKSKESDVDGRTGNEITIVCHDAYGKEYQYVITDFESQGKNHINTYFDDQYKLDYAIRDDISDSASGTYKSRSDAVGHILDQFRDFLNNSYDLAGTDATLDIPDAEYDNSVLEGNKSLLTFLKSKFNVFKPKFKLVIPEKAVETPTVEASTKTATIIEHDDHDDR